jgi:hypothetical protein
VAEYATTAVQVLWKAIPIPSLDDPVDELKNGIQQKAEHLAIANKRLFAGNFESPVPSTHMQQIRNKFIEDNVI